MHNSLQKYTAWPYFVNTEQILLYKVANKGQPTTCTANTLTQTSAPGPET